MLFSISPWQCTKVEKQIRLAWLLSEVRGPTEEGQTICKFWQWLAKNVHTQISTHISTKILRDCLSPYFCVMVHILESWDKLYQIATWNVKKGEKHWSPYFTLCNFNLHFFVSPNAMVYNCSKFHRTIAKEPIPWHYQVKTPLPVPTQWLQSCDSLYGSNSHPIQTGFTLVISSLHNITKSLVYWWCMCSNSWVAVVALLYLQGIQDKTCDDGLYGK